MPSHMEEERKKITTRIGAPNAGKRSPVQSSKQLEQPGGIRKIISGAVGGARERVGKFLEEAGEGAQILKEGIKGGVKAFASTLGTAGEARKRFGIDKSRTVSPPATATEKGRGRKVGTLSEGQSVTSVKKNGIPEGGVAVGTSGTRRLPGKEIEIAVRDSEGKVKRDSEGNIIRKKSTRARFVGTAKPTKKPTKQARGVQKAKDISPRTVGGIGRALDLFGEKAQQFLSPAAQKRRGAARAKAAGVKSRRAESETGSKRITALSKVLENTDDSDKRAAIQEQIRNIASPVDLEEGNELKAKIANR